MPQEEQGKEGEWAADFNSIPMATGEGAAEHVDGDEGVVESKRADDARAYAHTGGGGGGDGTAGVANANDGRAALGPVRAPAPSIEGPTTSVSSSGAAAAPVSQDEASATAIALMAKLEMTDAEKAVCEEQLTLDIMEGGESFESLERRLRGELERVRSRQAQLINDGPRIEEDAEYDDDGVLILPDDALGDLSPEEKQLLEQRRTSEFDLVSRFDKKEINPREDCWFLINTQWLNEWGEYMQGKGEPPDKISNLRLYEINGRDIKKNLRAKVHYRGVCSMTWYIFVELYGKDDAPELCRYHKPSEQPGKGQRKGAMTVTADPVVDIYDPPVRGREREKRTRKHGMQARIEVAKMKAEFMDSSDEEEDDDPHLCLCFTKDHLECVLYHLFTCCRYIGRRGPRYTKLAFEEEDEYDSSDDDEEHLGESRKARRKRLAKKKARKEAAKKARKMKKKGKTRAGPRVDRSGKFGRSVELV